MTHALILAEPAYSSWSMRAWLCMARTGADTAIRWVELYGDPPLAAQIDRPPARTVPVLHTADGAVIRDSLAIAEDLASRHPEAGLWPADPVRRGLARSLAAEMHSGFAALRGHCPMNLRTGWAAAPLPGAVIADLARIEEIWSDALARSGGPWLAGGWSVADAFFAPVAARIAGYALPVGRVASDYVARQLAGHTVRRWRGLALRIGPDRHDDPSMPYFRRLARAPFPGPEPIAEPEAVNRS